MSLATLAALEKGAIMPCLSRQPMSADGTLRDDECGAASMARKPNYDFERREREKAKAAKTAERAKAKAEKTESSKPPASDSEPVESSEK